MKVKNFFLFQSYSKTGVVNVPPFSFTAGPVKQVGKYNDIKVIYKILPNQRSKSK